MDMSIFSDMLILFSYEFIIIKRKSWVSIDIHFIKLSLEE